VFVRGLQASGVAACAKHFPGHGDTDQDSHLDLPVVRQPIEVLRQRELEPFRAVIAAGVDAVMTSHVVLPALDDRPATMSRRVLVELLRGELGFTGAIVTDALDMKGASGTRSIGEAAVAALAAGADLLCLGARQDEAVLEHVHAAVAAAVADRRLDEVRLAEAAGRASRLGSAPPGPPRPVDREVGCTAARRALRVEGAPTMACRGAHVVELRPEPNIAAGEVPWGLGPALHALDPDVTVTAVGPEDELDDAVLAGAVGRPLVVVVRDRHRHRWQAAHLDRLVAARPDAIVVDMGWPGAPPPGPPPPASRTWITTHGASRASAEAVAELLTRGASHG